MNIPYRVPLKVASDSAAYKLGVSRPQAVTLDMTTGVYAQIGEHYRGDYEVTPTENEQALTTNALIMDDDITVHAIPSDYVGSAIPRKDSLNVSGATVTADSGYYGNSASVTIPDAEYMGVFTPQISSQNISVGADGEINATVEISSAEPFVYQNGYAKTTDELFCYVSGSASHQLPTHPGGTIHPNETVQTAVAAGLFTTDDVEVSAIPSDYVGSGIPLRDSSDLTASNATVTAPAGYYENPASKSVDTMQLPATVSATYSGTKKADIAYSVGSGSKYLVIDKGYNTARQYYKLAQVPQGTEGTPTATKGAVNNHAVNITPSATNSAGYINGGTHTGTDVTVTASELVSGDKSITSAGTEDVTNYATATVAAGSATMPASISTNGTIAGALNNTMNVHATATATPSVTAGYVASGTSGNTSISIQVPVTTLNATTYNPQSTDRTIASGTYTIGTQTIKGAPLQTKSVTTNGDVTADAGYYGLGTVTVDVSGGGGNKNVQVAAGVNRVATTSYSAVSGQELTVAATGTYDVYWTGYRSSTGGTSGSQLYIGNTAYGSAQTTFSNNGQAVHLSNVSLTKDQVIAVRARARSTSYYMYVGNLTIVQN